MDLKELFKSCVYIYAFIKINLTNYNALSWELYTFPIMICLYSGVGENQQQLRKAKSSSGPAEWVNWEPQMKGITRYKLTI